MRHPITSRAKKIFLIGLTLNILICASYIWLLSIIRDKNENTISILTEVEFEQSRSTRLATAREVVEAAHIDAVKLASYGVENDQDQVAFVTFVEDIGKAAGVTVKVQNLKLELHEPAEERDYFSIDVNANGKWPQVMRFIKLLENIPMNIILDDLNLRALIAGIRSIDGPNPVPVWETSVHLRVLKFKS